MDAKKLKTVPKITVKIWRPLLAKFEQQMEASCLRRDAFLARLLERETTYLDDEVSICNSNAAHDYVSSSLELLDRKSVSLALPPELVTQLNEVCQRKRIVRDAFFNRLFLLLAASPQQIDSLLFPYAAGEWKHWVSEACKSDASSWQSEFYPLQPQTNPFWALREGLERYTEDLGFEEHPDSTTGRNVKMQRRETGELEPVDSLYTRFLDKRFANGDLTGLNCYVPDWRVPRHAAAIEHTRKQQEFDALF